MISLRSNAEVTNDGDVRCYFNQSELTASDQKEFVANAKYESELRGRGEGRMIFDDILAKSNFIKTFQSLVPRLEVSGGEKVLEMGGGHGWAAALVKAAVPTSYVTLSDLVPETVQHSSRWERLLNVKIDEKWSFNCRDMPFASEQFDRIFTFAAFHHFAADGSYEKALIEMVRVLRPGGLIALLYEPSAPRWLYRAAVGRVNRKRRAEGVDEDVLVCPALRETAQKLGCSFKAEPFPFYRHRDGVGATNYYYLLSKIRPLSRALVSTVNVRIHKPVNRAC